MCGMGCQTEQPHKARHVSLRSPVCVITPLLRHDGRALILRPWPQLSEECREKMINGSDLIPPAHARPFLNPANTISQRCQATSPRRMRMGVGGAPVAFLGTQRSRWIYFTQMASVSAMLSFTGCGGREVLMDAGKQRLSNAL